MQDIEHNFGRELAGRWYRAVEPAEDAAAVGDLELDARVRLFEHDGPVDPGQKLGDEPARQWEGRPDLQDRHGHAQLAERFDGGGISDASGNHPEASMRRLPLAPIEGRLLKVRFDLAQLLHEFEMQPVAQTRRGGPVAGILAEP